jgi:hypothetical protein
MEDAEKEGNVFGVVIDFLNRCTCFLCGVSMSDTIVGEFPVDEVDSGET